MSEPKVIALACGGVMVTADDWGTRYTAGQVALIERLRTLAAEADRLGQDARALLLEFDAAKGCGK